MAESVNNQLLSAVTEGHHSNTTVSGSHHSYSHSHTSNNSKNINSRKKIRESSNEEEKYKSLTSTTSRRQQYRGSLGSTSSRSIAKSQTPSPTTKRSDRKRTSDQNLLVTCEELSPHSNQKRRRQNPAENSTLREKEPNRKSAINKAETEETSNQTCGNKAVDRLLHENQAQQPHTTQTKSNLLSYYRKTRGHRSSIGKKSAGSELSDHDYPSTANSFENLRELQSAQGSQHPNIVNNQKSSNNRESKSSSQLDSNKGSGSTSGRKLKNSPRDRKSPASNVDRNRKTPHNSGNRSSSAIRNLRSTISESGNNSHSQRQPISCSSSDNFTAPQQLTAAASFSAGGGFTINSSANSDSITFNHGAVPKKRQKVGDYSEYLFTSSTAGGNSLINSGGGAGVHQLPFASSVAGSTLSSSPSATAGTSSGISDNLVPISLQATSSTTTTTGYSKAPNLGARLARSGGATRDATHQHQQQQHNNSSLQTIINQNYQTGLSGAIGDSALLTVNSQGTGIQVVGGPSTLSSSSHILRRSSRGKTGSCVSSSAAAQGSGSGVAASSSSLSTATALAGTSHSGSASSSRAATHYSSHLGSHRTTSASAVSSAHSSSSKGGGGGRGSSKHYEVSAGAVGGGGPSTSSTASHLASVMANDSNRPSAGGNSKLLKPKQLKQKLNNHQTANLANSGGVDITTATNLNQMGQQSSGVANGSAASGGGSGSMQGSTQPSGSSANNSVPTNTAHPDSESDDSEVGRLQALLEARGLPPHLFGALGPRMTHILHRTIGASSSSKAQQLLQGLQSHDESQQLQAAIEMCQMLVMGNEDTLAGFPIKQVVPALIHLLRMEHNFDIMNNACRALAYMLEALPRSSGTVVDGIPVFLEKLQVIQCMDVAEQSLTALEILSRRHNKAILQANGVSACLTYLDFFSINAQRAALAITANCCLSLHPEEFHFVSESLPLLAPLLAQQDKKCVESVCTAFYRLVESFQHDPKKLQEIASKELLKNCQQLLVVTPSVLNTGTFTNVVRMLGVMCANSPDLAISLLKNDIASTLLYLLTGSAEPSQGPDVELVSRSPSELYEITCLIGELMPRLPTDGIFSVDMLLERTAAGAQDQVQWQWRDDRGVWHSYSSIDSRMIEAAHMNSDDEISLSTLGRTYTVDFHSMQQINEDTGTTRAVQRKINTNYVGNVSAGQDLSSTGSTQTQLDYETRLAQRDARIACLKEERGLASEFIKNLFSVLYEVYSSSAGPAVRYKCLRALLRMVFYASGDLLRDVLKNQIVSSHIAGMMASNDLRIVVGALQMAEILMQKLPEVFGTHFRREGVIHQITQLADPSNPICANPSPKPAGSGTLSAPPSASGFQANPFDFDTSTPTSSKTDHGNSHVKNLSHAMNVLHTKMSVSLPSTSAAPLQIPSAGSSALAISLSGPPPASMVTSEVVHPLTMASSLPNNGNFVMYSTSAVDPRQYSYHHPPPHYQPQSVDLMSNQPSSGTDATASVPSYSIPPPSSTGNIQNKVSDILKRKVPPKRKSQSSGRSKPRPDEAQDLINRTSAIGSGSSGRNTPSSSSSASRSRFGVSSSAGATSGSGGGSSSKTSFLASLNPARWGRQGSHHSSFAKDSSSTNASNISKSASNANLIAAGNREKARQWIRDQAISFISRYTEQEIAKSIHPAASVLSRLSVVIQKLDGNNDDCLEALRELRNILIESDISPFEVNHSGLIRAMLIFMSSEQGIVPRDNRLRAFLHIFAGLPKNPVIPGGGLPAIKSTPFSAFVAKLHGCVTQLEQFPVRVHDFPAGPGGRSNTSALKFFNTHQLKCNLQRHPDCSNLRQWKGGTVKIDPLALVQAIERYLVVRGYGGIRGDSEDDSEEDMDDNVAAVAMSQSGFKHRLQFLIGEHVLPYNMTVYQAVKQYSPVVNDQSETDTESETPIGNASIWVQQHTIYYRPIDDDHNVSGGSSKGSSSTSKKSGKSSSSKLMRKKTEFWLEGIVPCLSSPLTPFLTSSLPADIVTVQDASLDALCMLRIINGLNRHWESLYTCTDHENLINQSEFVHSKITAKANRQLQDPLVIMTGNLPQWLQQIALACPFLFPFETRHLLFYAISFDRDRALQRLLDTAPDLNSSDTTERVTPRLDRRKRAISREDILKQAEHIIQDFGHSKALLEIQYDNEVGTGLGPTLEFYALVSAELQRCDLGLWNGSDSYKQNSSTIADIVKSGLTQIDDGNESSGGNNGSSGVLGDGQGVGGNNRHSMGGVATTNNALNQSIDSGSYIAYENTVNMIIEQQADVHMTSHRMSTANTQTIPNTRSLVIENEADRDHRYQVNQENNINRTSHDNVQQIRNAPPPPPPIARSVTTTYVNAPHGLFPLPLGKAAKLSQISRVKSKFKFLGKFIAKAVMDSRMLDLPFSIPFYRWLLCEESTLSLADLAWVAPEVQATLVRLLEVVRQRDSIQNDPGLDVMEKTEKIEQLDLDGCPIADLGLDFVLPGHANIELRRGGRDIPVTIHNLHQYISLVTHWFLVEGVQRQFEAIREGFDIVFLSARLRMFYPEEMENVFCGTGATNYQRWDIRMLQECCRTDHGFTQDSQAIRFLYEILSTYSRDEQRLFLQFVTGSPRLPTGGFKALTPPLTIVRKTLDPNQNPDDYLPSVMTCVNYLKLPEYSSREVMRAKLKVAVSEGSMSFHLS
ncbi:E3 ubiquitin-protein ligase TRIP12 isoform X3 [Hermetia illucens]|uniref:E3 ubiquitin-protein ligase TRIP12 isoform X3 n=1 Tax=Hermetia illucens TaxID=343691 RepID=UPI0018CC3A7F|nr:E3 ubiquitin-protein ligase TRIP12 isoform X3 [Hermetia illucens]